MPNYLCVSVTFLDPVPEFHGRGDAGEPEWPPSPLRVFQAIVAAAASRWREAQFQEHARPALEWLQGRDASIIVAPSYHVGVPVRIAVPNNDLDVVATAWSKRQEPKKQPNELKTMKTVRATRLLANKDASATVHYLFPLADGGCPHLELLAAAAHGITHLGWGIDMVVGDTRIISGEQAASLDGQRWRPTPAGGTPLRVPKEGTLGDLMRKHEAFLNRLSDDGFRPVPPLKVFEVCGYRCDDEPTQRPPRVFELRTIDGTRCRYPHRRLIHIAGMVRHLAIKAMKASPPPGVDEDWVRMFVAGHARDGKDTPTHRQFSYLPLQSIGAPHTDPGVRRIMIVAPLGDEAWLDHVARHLAWQALEPVQGDEFAGGERPVLVPVQKDNIARIYTQAANTWASVTPVILPGHDDHKPEKTRKLIEKALAQSGIEQPCDFEWSPFSRFPKSFSAHKCDKEGRLTGYIRPDHLLTQTAVHLVLRFQNGLKVPGPLAIGAGRHCGLGLLAPCE